MVSLLNNRFDSIILQKIAAVLPPSDNEENDYCFWGGTGSSTDWKRIWHLQVPK